MNDWNTEVIGQYELEVESLRKGRGAWIFETDRGLKLLKEYKGTVKRLEFEEKVLKTVEECESLQVDQYMRNREGELISWPRTEPGSSSRTGFPTGNAISGTRGKSCPPSARSQSYISSFGTSRRRRNGT